MYRVLLLAFMLVCFGSSGCRRMDAGLNRPDLSNRKARIVATTGMIADTAKQIAGDYMEVECLMGPGVDPHNFTPTASDLAKLQGADLILYNGLHLEGQMDEVFEKMAKRIRTTAVTKTLSPEQIRHADPTIQGGHDPHVWFDVKRWMLVTECIREELVDLDPKNAERYRENADRYLAELAELDRFVREQANRLTSEQRVLITCHDAFGYFGDAYGFEVRGLQGVSTEGQVGITERTKLASFIAERHIPTIFGETSVPDTGIKALQESVQNLGHRVNLAQRPLYSDALGEPGTPTASYVGMVRYNITTIVEALMK